MTESCNSRIPDQEYEVNCDMYGVPGHPGLHKSLLQNEKVRQDGSAAKGTCHEVRGLEFNSLGPAWWRERAEFPKVFSNLCKPPPNKHNQTV